MDLAGEDCVEWCCNRSSLSSWGVSTECPLIGRQAAPPTASHRRQSVAGHTGPLACRGVQQTYTSFIF